MDEFSSGEFMSGELFSEIRITHLHRPDVCSLHSFPKYNLHSLKERTVYIATFRLYKAVDQSIGSIILQCDKTVVGLNDKL